MNQRTRHLAAGLLVGWAVLASADSFDDAVRELGDPDPRVRQQAEKTLKDAGPAAEQALTRVAASDDPEASRRAKSLLRQFASAAIPELEPEAQSPHVARYRNADRDAKIQIIGQISGGSGSRLTSFVRLWKEEDEEEFRTAMYRVMLQFPGAYAQAMLTMGDQPAAEQLLEAALTQGDAGSAGPAYVALCVERGAVAEAISQWAPRGPSPALARLYLAGRDARSAVEIARQSGDAALLEEMLLAARDWRGLADRVQARTSAAPIGQPRDLGLLAASQFMAADDKALNDTFDRMRKLATPQTIDDVAHMMMLCDRHADGMRLLVDAGKTLEQFRLLAAQERFDDAWALVPSSDKDKSEDAARLRILAARQLAYLGEKKQAIEQLARVADENFGPRNPDIDAEIAEAYRFAGASDKAWEHFQAALKAENAGPGASSKYAWRAFTPSDDGGDRDIEYSGRAIWEFMRWRYPQETIEQRFDRAKSVRDQTGSIAELREMVEGAPAAAEPQPQPRRNDVRRNLNGLARLRSARSPAYSMQLVRMLGQRMYDSGDHQGAAQYLADAVEKTPDPGVRFELYMRLGEWAGLEKAWPRAADWYGKAWNLDRVRSAPLYLRARAIANAGWPARAAELFHIAYTAPLADIWKRNEAIQLLNQQRLDDLALREVQTVLATSSPSQFPADAALRYMAQQAVRSGDYLAAADWLERANVNIIASYQLNDAVQYLRFPHMVHRYRAKGLLARNDLAAAEKEIAAARALLPGDVMLAIAVVPEFEKQGNKPRADDLYNESMRAMERVIARYPNSANHHNNIAWLAVNCERDSDKALAHARRAVELEPQNAAYLDTLAEVEFRRGDIEAAIAAMKRCLELQPRNTRHREQFERFEAARRGERRPMPPE